MFPAIGLQLDGAQRTDCDSICQKPHFQQSVPGRSVAAQGGVTIRATPVKAEGGKKEEVVVVKEEEEEEDVSGDGVSE